MSIESEAEEANWRVMEKHGIVDPVESLGDDESEADGSLSCSVGPSESQSEESRIAAARVLRLSQNVTWQDIAECLENGG